LLAPFVNKPGLSADRLKLAKLLMAEKQAEPVVSADDFERFLKAILGKGGGYDGEDRSAQIISLFFELAKANPERSDAYAQVLGKILIKWDERQRREIMEMILRGDKAERPDLVDLLFDKVKGRSKSADELAKSSNYPEEEYYNALRQAYRLLEDAGIHPSSKRKRRAKRGK
jgi:hypothetical protein